MSPRKTSEVEAFRRAMQQLVRRFGSLAADGTPCGKPLSLVHAHALMTLLTKGKLSQQELGVELCIDKSNVARVCAKMVEAGHAIQRQDEQDLRSRQVSLSARGLKLAQEVEAASTARFAELLSLLPPGQTETIVGAIEQVVAALKSFPNGEDGS